MKQRPNVAPIKNIKQAVQYQIDTLEEANPPDQIHLLMGFSLAMPNLDCEQAKTRLRKFQQALSQFDDDQAAEMLFDFSLTNAETREREKDIMKTTQTKLNTWIELQGKPNEIETATADQVKAVESDTDIQKKLGELKGS